jgi:hypothetical protein
MATYTKQMQRIVSEYRVSGQPWPSGTRTIANWAIETGRWQLPASAAISKCAEDLQAAMREDYFTDERGRRVRRLHPATIRANGQQLVLWDDIRTASRDHMHLSFQQRRRGIVGDLRQLKVDVDSFNHARTDVEPIQIEFDFTMDLAEIEAIEAA